jgi:hypothetical protein
LLTDAAAYSREALDVIQANTGMATSKSRENLRIVFKIKNLIAWYIGEGNGYSLPDIQQ